MAAAPVDIVRRLGGNLGQAARRAILRCQKGGYNLPVEKYEHWREIEMTFNPEKMRIE